MDNAWLHTDNAILADTMLAYYPGILKEAQIQKERTDDAVHYLFGPLNHQMLEEFLQQHPVA
jgi:hypothetical protein